MRYEDSTEYCKSLGDRNYFIEENSAQTIKGNSERKFLLANLPNQKVLSADNHVCAPTPMVDHSSTDINLVKQDLAAAEVIGQVDKKYILVKMPSYLALLDQQ